ncbi:Na+/H+ antiporter NhaD type [Desulfocucumis palustris]|uniref:Na+/H+ antiporter NhaD type n=1 Tax=Desulfocucumis palustris TaxID=1898651 RepID=A0A2L2X9T0_9FIRM|nr:ArsB/NhaD family transporter [Desulfocucumis palustris]GBF33027.1 Na+/H+ antiporter NhaD type [Desulfocucumis palustris]
MSESTQALFATAIFLLTYGIIVSEKIHRTVVALVGAGLIALTKILSPEQAVEAIDFNTIGLLVGMMIIVGITRQTGVFEYLAIKAAKHSQGQPLKIMAALALVTAVLSAFLDNVTTVLLIVPVTFAIAKKLEIDPLPVLIAEILASNIGGTATLIGDPPNIMIGSATGLGFVDFMLNLTPVIAVTYVFTIFFLRIIYRKQLITKPELQKDIMSLNEKDEIKDPALLRKCLLVLALTISGFILHQFVHLESSVIALSGASLLLLLSREDPEHVLHAVEWPVIFFFVGLFILVGALEHVGVIEAVAKLSLDITGGQMVPTAMLILWISAIASAFVDNIPFVATMIPLIQDMGRLGGIDNLNLLWWSLSLGACLGGNGTIIGASANVVVIGMAEKRGFHISFVGFMKVAFPLMILSIILSTGYLLLWYYVHGAVMMVGVLALAFVLALVLNPITNALSRKDTPKETPGPHKA